MPKSNVTPPAPGGISRERQPGRRPTTTRRELERVAVALFAERGFDQTTVEDIARAGGIGRRTFFRYFESKNDVIWGEFDVQLARMGEAFAALPDDVPLMDGIVRVVVAVNRYDPDDVGDLRRRMTLIASTPALQAHSTLRYDAWRGAVAEFVARRIGQHAGDLVPATIAGATLGVATATYTYWLGHGGPTEGGEGEQTEGDEGGPAEHTAGGPAEHTAGGPAEHTAGGPAEQTDLPGLLGSALEGLARGFTDLGAASA
jgi:mycofactocin system transcriptional regulator